MKIVILKTELTVMDSENQQSYSVVGLYVDEVSDLLIRTQVLIEHGMKFLNKPSPACLYDAIEHEGYWYAICGEVKIESLPNSPVGLLGRDSIDMC